MLLIFIDFAFSRSPNEQILDDYQQLKLLNKINRMSSKSLLKRSTTRIQRYAHFFSISGPTFDLVKEFQDLR